MSTAAILLFLFAYLVVGWFTLTSDHYWGDDWAQYIMHARNLATGHAYADTGYIFNPDFPSEGPASYPPGTPLVLAPVVALFGIDIVALKVPMLLCLALALPVAVRLMAPVIGIGAALVGVAIVALHPQYWGLRQWVNSDAPYMLFSMLALWWAQRPVSRETRQAFTSGAMLGVLLFAALSCRTVGLALLPAIAVHGIAHRRRWSWFAGLAVVLLAALGAESMLLAPPPTYQGELRSPTVSRVSAQPLGYLAELANIFPAPMDLSLEAALFVLAASFVGLGFTLVRRRADGETPGTGPFGMLARVPIFAWYLGAYMAALFLASIAPNQRLLTPVLPIAIPLAVHGVQVLVSRRIRPRLALGGMAILGMAYVVALDAIGRASLHGQVATCRECLEMFAFVRDKTPPDSVIVFSKPRAMALLGARHSWPAAWRYTPEQLDSRIRKFGGDYFVGGVQGSEFARRFPQPAAVRERMAAPGADVVFRNGEFEIVRVGQASHAR